jgi:hypothetical protein
MSRAKKRRKWPELETFSIYQCRRIGLTWSFGRWYRVGRAATCAPPFDSLDLRVATANE